MSAAFSKAAQSCASSGGKSTVKKRKLIDIRANTDLPVGIGFGIKDAETAKIIAGLGDAVVVGSALISKIEANLSAPEVAKQALSIFLILSVLLFGASKKIWSMSAAFSKAAQSCASSGGKSTVKTPSFITAGDPNPEFTVPMMHAMVKAGADVIELGVPFSDPMADGPVIQRASERALEHKMSLRRTLDIVSEFRTSNQSTPVVLIFVATSG
jgi:tryptophan synthase alpha subunit